MSASPGTYPYFDWGYATNFPDLLFVGAAVLLARVISGPAERGSLGLHRIA